ncbi:hypothetical protein CLV30_12518 [Haloactinopolyspora alba]|uniref:N-acetyltransferase domain-containing protein n=2 Tax=Haloactinopolyspora alba TaxID=648780 RepID=A0A2P8DHF2_9ACTN|nr:hypothetical protein CLV30_12518 [Haloactinopolyspora alba]
MYLDAFEGRFPPADGAVTVLGPPGDGLECSVAFTGHAVVATALPPDEVVTADEPGAAGPDGYGGSMAPDFLRRLAGPDGWVGVIDLTLVAPGRGEPSLPRRTDADGHDRVRRARALRRNVDVYGDDRGLLTLADGLAGRREISIETEPGGDGRGRSLLTAALGHVPAGEPVFAAVSPGNARSLRAFLAAGFVPVGSEVLLRPGRR